MIVEPYQKGQPVGPQFRRIMRLGAEAIKKKNDDFIFVIAGTAGKGKSSLGLWTYEDLDPNANISQVALTRSDFAISFDEAGKKEGFRYLQYDEGKMNRRDWQSEWSKELLELYHDCRGDNIFHVWCTAMPELLDRVFVEERVKGFAFIYSKGDFARRFLYFTKNDLLRFMEANDNKISSKLLDKYGRSFASLDSYFLKYQGRLWADYEAKKKERLTERRSAFREKWASDGWQNASQVKAILGVAGHPTVTNWTTKLVQAGIMTPGEDFTVIGAGSYKFSPKGIDKLKDYAEELRNKSVLGPLVREKGLSRAPIQLFSARKEKNRLIRPPIAENRSMSDVLRSGGLS